MNGKIVGVILSGGHSRRFGEPKAFAKNNGIPFYQCSIKAMAPKVDELVLVTNNELILKFRKEPISFQIFTDHPTYYGQGPLAGIWTTMEYVKAEWYCVLPIDVPMITSDIIGELIKYLHTDLNTEAVIPCVDGKLQPLIAIYHSSVKDKIKLQLDENRRSLHGLLEKLDYKLIPFESDLPFININYRSDYNQIFLKENFGGT